jgi:outer membrane protein assembly factor BamA
MVSVRQNSKFALCRVILSPSVALLAVLLPVASMPEQRRSVGQSTSEARVQTGDSEQKTSEPGSEPVKKATKKEKRGEIVIAPIPISSPAIGSGLLLGFGYVFPLNKNDKVSPPSVIGGMGFRTSNGSRGWAILGTFNFREDRYRIAAIGGRGSVNYDLFGIGTGAGATGISVPINQKGTLFLGQFLYRVGGWHLGPRYQVRQSTVRPELADDHLPEGIEIPETVRQSKTAALGPQLMRDRRDSLFYSRNGSVFKVGADLFSKGLGSKFSYQSYQVAFNKYTSLSPRQVLAFRVMGCGVGGDVPFYDLCLFGFNNDLRGYYAGQFRDRRMFATQLEYRLELLPRVGVVGFAGVGGVAPEFSKFRGDELLPSGGGGFRLTVAKKNHINLRFDFGFGRVGHTFSMGVAEAF